MAFASGHLEHESDIATVVCFGSASDALRRHQAPGRADECNQGSANPETGILGDRLWTTAVDRTLHFAMLKLYE